MIEDIKFNGKRWPWKLVKSEHMSDWYVLVDADGTYVSDACIEGTSEEWKNIAACLRYGHSTSWRRCAVRWETGKADMAYMFSPRNTHGGEASLSSSQAQELAERIDIMMRETAPMRNSLTIRDKLLTYLGKKVRVLVEGVEEDISGTIAGVEAEHFMLETRLVRQLHSSTSIEEASLLIPITRLRLLVLAHGDPEAKTKDPKI